MLGKLGIRAFVTSAVVTAGLVTLAAPADAIQTKTWGVQPAAHDGQARGAFAYPSNGQTVHDVLEVFNLSARPETFDLSVLAATKRGTSYQYALERTGLAARVSLAGYHVTVPPDRQANVPVTVKMPRHSDTTTLAGIAAEVAPLKRGDLLIQERLVILVEATPTTSSPALPDLGVWGPVAGGLLAVAAALLGREGLRRRRRAGRPVVAAAAPPEPVAAAGAR